MRTWPCSRHPAAALHARETTGPPRHPPRPRRRRPPPSPDAAGHADNDRSPLPDPSPLPFSDGRQRRHTNHTPRQTRALTAAHARSHLDPHTVPSPGVCARACVTSRHLPASFPRTAPRGPVLTKQHPQAPPPTPPRRPSSSSPQPGSSARPGQHLRLRSEDVLSGTPRLSSEPHF